MPDTAALLELVSRSRLGTLATLKSDGRPQLSTIMYTFDPSASTVRVSVTDGRAKTANARRDPRVSMHVVSADGWSWTVVEGAATLSDVTREPGDAASEELVELYRAISGGEHPDWAEYRRAMVTERRLVLRLAVHHVYGQRRA